MKKDQDLYQRIADMLPPVFYRADLKALTRGLFNGRTIANLQSRGLGPQGFKIGNRMAFDRVTFLTWVALRSVTMGLNIHKQASLPLQSPAQP